jgi:sensor histidine kinase YesM
MLIVVGVLFLTFIALLLLVSIKEVIMVGIIKSKTNRIVFKLNKVESGLNDFIKALKKDLTPGDLVQLEKKAFELNKEIEEVLKEIGSGN